MDQLYKYNGITQRRMNRAHFKEHYLQRKQKRSQAFDGQRLLTVCDDSFNEAHSGNAEVEANSNTKRRGKTRIPVRCVSKTRGEARRILAPVTEEKPKPFVVGKVRHKIHSPPFLHNPLKTGEARTPYLPMTYQSIIPDNYKFTAPKGLVNFKHATPKIFGNSPFTLKSLLLPRMKKCIDSPLDGEREEHPERDLHKVKRELWSDEEPPIFGRTNVAKAREKKHNKDLNSEDGVTIFPSTSRFDFDSKKNESFIDKENISFNEAQEIKNYTPYPLEVSKSLVDPLSKNFGTVQIEQVEIENQVSTDKYCVSSLKKSTTVKSITENLKHSKKQLNTKISSQGSMSMSQITSHFIPTISNASSSSHLKTKKDSPHPSQINKSLPHSSFKHSKTVHDNNAEVENQVSTDEDCAWPLNELKTNECIAESLMHSKKQSSGKISRKGSISMSESTSHPSPMTQNISLSSHVKTKKDSPHPSQINKSLLHSSFKHSKTVHDNTAEVENQVFTDENRASPSNELKTNESIAESLMDSKKLPSGKISSKGSISMSERTSHPSPTIQNISLSSHLKTKKDPPHPSQINKSLPHISFKNSKVVQENEAEVKNQGSTDEDCASLLNESTTGKLISDSLTHSKKLPSGKISHQDSILTSESTSHHLTTIQYTSLSSSLKKKNNTSQPSELSKSLTETSFKRFETFQVIETKSNNELESAEHCVSPLNKSTIAKSKSCMHSKKPSNTKIGYQGSISMSEDVPAILNTSLSNNLKTKNDTLQPSQLNKSLAYPLSEQFTSIREKKASIQNLVDSDKHCDSPLNELKTDERIAESLMHSKKQSNTKICRQGSISMPESTSHPSPTIQNTSLSSHVKTIKDSPHPSQINKSLPHSSFKHSKTVHDNTAEVENQVFTDENCASPSNELKTDESIAKSLMHSKKQSSGKISRQGSISMSESPSHPSPTIQNTSLSFHVKTKKDSPHPSQINKSLLHSSFKHSKTVHDNTAEVENQVFTDENCASPSNELKTDESIAKSLIHSKKQSSGKISRKLSISMPEGVSTIPNTSSNSSLKTKNGTPHPSQINKSLPRSSFKHSKAVQDKKAEVENQVSTDEDSASSVNGSTTGKLILDSLMHSKKQVNAKISREGPMSEGDFNFPKIIIECTTSPERIKKKIEILCDDFDKCPITVLKKQSEKITKAEVIDLVSDDEEEDSYKVFIQKVLNNCAKRQQSSDTCAASPLANLKINITPAASPKVVKRNKKKVSANPAASDVLHTPKINISPAKTPKTAKKKKKELLENPSPAASLLTPVRVLNLRSRNIEVSPSPNKSTPRRRRKKDEVSRV